MTDKRAAIFVLGLLALAYLVLIGFIAWVSR